MSNFLIPSLQPEEPQRTLQKVTLKVSYALNFRQMYKSLAVYTAFELC